MSTTRTLLIDADDTLWENNIYYERVIREFVAALVARGRSDHQVQESLWQTEQRNIQVTGYGSNAFCRSLHEVARALDVADLKSDINRWENFICHHPIELMPGVCATLPLLHAQHQLILFTKGHPAEQLGKLERSGMAGYFHASEVVFEKSVAAYRDTLQKHGLNPRHTWMIGNSPRSDINPAKAAGLHTVFIPYHTTWQHEMEVLAPDSDTLVLENFGQLAQHFIKEPS
jgi:putative hydrolase of the HAD superfamily